MSRVRVVLIDDHSLFRAALKTLLKAATDIPLEVVAEASNATEAYTCFERGDFDVVILDLMLPGSSGLTVLNEARRRKLQQPRLVLSAHTEPDMITEAIAAGASGYVSKVDEPAELFEALRAVLRGGMFLPRSLPSEMLAASARRSPTGDTSPRGLLSPREREVFELLIQGYSNHEVATHLFISPKTVETHRAHILTKLGVHSICGLVRLASRHNLLSVGEVVQAEAQAR
jgi:DNA-binding NarL/FixJ family response regulator